MRYYYEVFEPGRREIPPPKLVKTLRGFDLLPAIVFLPTRRKCDEAALETAADKGQMHDPERFLRRKELFDSHAAENPEIGRHKHRKILVNSGIASHHAGHIPAWKLLVEKMMSAGLLNAIFATSTVAAGVDFPARTVVISNADTRGSDGWRPLSASELQQMTGRAGRRGKDNVGFVILAPGQFQNPQRIAELLKAPPDPLESKFRSTYTSLLNLLDAFGNFEQLREIAERSFAFRATANQIAGMRRKYNEIQDELSAEIVDKGFLLTVNDVLGFERLASARQRLDSYPTDARLEMHANWLAENVTAGRIVTFAGGGKRLFLVLQVTGDTVQAMRDDGRGRKFPLLKVKRIFTKPYGFVQDLLEKAFLEVMDGRNPPLAEPKLKSHFSSADAGKLLDSLIEKFIPSAKKDSAAVREFLWSAIPKADLLVENSRFIEYLRGGIWNPFLNRARVLDHFGYLDYRAEKVTGEGKWLADVRVDRPLLIGEALRHGLFENRDAGVAAGLAASLAADVDRDYGRLDLTEGLEEVITSFESIIRLVSRIESKFGVVPESEINLSAAAAAEAWADGASWNELVAETRAEEGDLFRLLSRTGEVLLQLGQLKESNPAAAAISREAASAVLRDPVR